MPAAHINFQIVELEKNVCESLGQQGDPTSPSKKRSVLSVHWKDWCWSWNSNTLATWCKELTHLKRSWCWERWRAGGEGDDRGWDGWMASLTQCTWAWVNSRSLWWTGRPRCFGPWCLKESDTTEWLNWLTNWYEVSWILSIAANSYFIVWIEWTGASVLF